MLLRELQKQLDELVLRVEHWIVFAQSAVLVQKPKSFNFQNCPMHFHKCWFAPALSFTIRGDSRRRVGFVVCVVLVVDAGQLLVEAGGLALKRLIKVGSIHRIIEINAGRYVIGLIDYGSVLQFASSRFSCACLQGKAARQSGRNRTLSGRRPSRASDQLSCADVRSQLHFPVVHKSTTQLLPSGCRF